MSRPLRTSGGDRPPVVFIPGWGFDNRILSLARPPLPWHSPEGFVDPASFHRELLEFLGRKGLDQIRLVGWSMGAHLALDFARDYSERVAELFLLAMRHEWPTAEIEAIRKEFAGGPREFLASFYRKCFVGDRPHYQLFQDTLEEDYLRALPPGILHRGLDYLARARTLPAPVATRLIHGRQDRIAPLGGRAELPESEVDIIERGGHLVFLSSAFSLAKDPRGLERQPGVACGCCGTQIGERCMQAAAFLGEPAGAPGSISRQQPGRAHPAGIGKEDGVICGRFAHAAGGPKEELRRRFSRAASTYDRHAGIQQEVARLLAARLPSAPLASVLEIGCGTGGYTLALAERFPRAELLALDFSATMLEAAAGKLGVRPGLRFQCEDAELFLDRPGGPFDLITSNATCHWFADLGMAVANIRRLLTSSGIFLASIFGPATLEELREGLSFLFGRPVPLPAGRFPEAEDLRRLLDRQFAGSELEEIRIIRRYRTLPELLHHIRNTGTAGWQKGPPPVFTRGRLQRLDDWFAAHHGGYRVTYQVFLVKGKK